MKVSKCSSAKLKPREKAKRLKRKNPEEKSRKNKRRHGFSMKEAVASPHQPNVLWIRQQAIEAEMADTAFKLEVERGKRPRMYVA